MSLGIDLKKIERKAYMSFNKDGLLDIVIGSFILGFGISMTTNTSVTSVLAWIPILFLVPAKRLITYPRIGYVKPSPERKAKEKKRRAILSIILLLTAIGGMVPFLVLSGKISFPPQWVSWFKGYSFPLFGAVLAVIIGVVAYAFEVSRLYAYAVLTLIAFAGDRLLSVHPSLSLISLGAIVLLSGLVVLIRFLRKYPKIAEEVSDGKGN